MEKLTISHLLPNLLFPTAPAKEDMKRCHLDYNTNSNNTIRIS
jgi:hypothetical protein